MALALPAAAFQTWQIEQVYSNADGRVQFIVLNESAGCEPAPALRQDGQHAGGGG
jgi:hypothetical protein